MPKAYSKLMWMQDLLLFLVLLTPAAGHYTLPFLYMPIKPLLPGKLATDPKHFKVTTEHIRSLSGWSFEKAYSENMQGILGGLPLHFYQSSFTAADLADLNYHWSYEIPFKDINSSFSEQNVALVLKPSDFQQELLKFTGEKFLFAVDNVASRLGIPVNNLSNSYDPGDWETVVHAMISESALAFAERFQLPSVDSLAQLVQIAICTNTRFYVDARHKNMSYLKTAFSAFADSSISFVDLVETVTKLPWRQNVWPFGLKMEDWTVLYVLNQDTFKGVSGITAGEFMSKTLLQVFELSVQLQSENDQALRVKVNQNRGPT